MYPHTYTKCGQEGGGAFCDSAAQVTLAAEGRDDAGSLRAPPAACWNQEMESER